MLNFDADVKNTTARHQCENKRENRYTFMNCIGKNIFHNNPLVRSVSVKIAGVLDLSVLDLSLVPAERGCQVRQETRHTERGRRLRLKLLFTHAPSTVSKSAP